MRPLGRSGVLCGEKLRLIKLSCNGRSPVVSKKPKFMYRPDENGSWFAKLGRKLRTMKKAGIEDWGVKDRHRWLHEQLKERNVTTRHVEWEMVYDEAFEKAFSRAVEDQCKNEKQARKYARTIGENAVLAAFHEDVTSNRAVRNAMNKQKSDVDE